MIRKLLSRIALIAAAAALANFLTSRREHVQGRARAKPPPLQTWEGEGGAVPVGGSRIAGQADDGALR